MQIKISYDRPITETIQQRKSIRTYQNNADFDTEFEILQQAADKLGNDHFRFVWVEQESNNYLAERIGTYGVIKGARFFLAGIMKKGLEKQKETAVQFGYEFEQIVLKATELGLGTCWLGGTFNAPTFTKDIDLKRDERIIMVSPIGKPAQKKHLISKITSKTANSGMRKPWKTLFFEGDLTHTLSNASAGAYAPALEMVRLAPSAVNSQPWRIIQDRSGFHFFAADTNYFAMGKERSLRYNDMGIAMAHFELCCREIALKGDWEIERPDNLQKIELEYISFWKTNSQKNSITQ